MVSRTQEAIEKNDNTKKKTKELLQQYFKAETEEDKIKLRNEIALLNQGLVEYAIKFFPKCRLLDEDDLKAVGFIGLINGVERFDERYINSNTFSTYALHWVKQAIQAEIAKYDRAIYMPLHAINTANKINKFRYEYNISRGRYPTEAETCKEFKIKPDELRRISIINQEVMSLNDMCDAEDGDTEFMEFVQDTFTRTPEIEVIYKDAQDRVQSLFDTKKMNDREREVLSLRNGFETHNGSGEIETLETIGAKLGVTRERVRQIEKSARKKINTRNSMPVDKSDIDFICAYSGFNSALSF